MSAQVLLDQIAEPARPGGRSAPEAYGGYQDPPRLRGQRGVGGTAGGVLDAWHCRDSVSFFPAAISLHRISRREFLIGISGYMTALSRHFRGSQRCFSTNTRISVNFPRWRAHFVMHGRSHGH
jgi:hypothetical protein